MIRTLAVFILLSISSLAQITIGGPILFGSGAPANPCPNNALYVRTDTTGGIYSCQNAAWVLATAPASSVVPTISPNPSSLNFVANVGQFVTDTLKITAGTVPASFNITVADTTDYAFNFSQCQQPLAANTSCSGTVTFTPSSATTLNSTLSIAVVNGATTSVTLNGTGTTPPTSATASSLALSPSSPTITVGNTQQFTGTLTMSDSSTRVFTGWGNTQVWNSSAAAAVTPALVGTPEFCAWTGTASTINCAAQTHTVGNLVLVWNYGTASSSSFTVSDSNLNSFRCSSSVSSRQYCWALNNKTASDTVTCTVSANTNGCAVAEFSGVMGTPDSAAGGLFNTGASGTALALAQAFTTTSTDVIIVCGTANTTGAFTASASYTIFSVHDNGFSSGCEYQLSVAAGSQNPGLTSAGTSSWTIGAIAFPVASQQVASVNNQGVATGIGAGTSTISANSAFVVQTNSSLNCSSSGTGILSQTCQFLAPQQQGDTNVLLILSADATSTYGTPSDSCGNTYTLQAHSQGNGLSAFAYTSIGIVGCASNTITETWTGGGASSPVIIPLEVTNLSASPLDVAVATTAANALCSPGAISTAQAAEFMAIACVTSSGNTVSGGNASVLSAGYQYGDLFASGTQTDNLTATAAVSAAVGITLKSVIGSQTLTVNAGSTSIWTITVQQPTTQEYYAGSPFTKTLPADVGSHLSTSPPSDATTSNIFAGNPSNASVTVLSTSPSNGANSGFASSFCYASSSDPIFKVTSVVNPPSNVTFSPLNQFFHLTSGCPFDNSAASSDKFLMVWDQSTDIDPTAGGRILAAYDFGAANKAVPSNCTCTTQACASTTAACQIGLYFGQMSHPQNDTIAINEGGGAPGTSALFAPGAGEIREQEIMNNQINHAIMLDTGCLRSATGGGSGAADAPVFPAFGNAGGCGFVDANRPLNGNWFYIDSGYNCSALPAWQKPVCLAMQNYGGFIHDTGGSNGSSGGIYIVGIEAGMAHSLAGVNDPFFDNWIIASGDTWNCGGGGYPKTCTGTNGAVLVEDSATTSHKANLPFFNMPGLLSPTNHLHIIDPCVAKRQWGQAGSC